MARPNSLWGSPAPRIQPQTQGRSRRRKTSQTGLPGSRHSLRATTCVSSALHMTSPQARVLSTTTAKAGGVSRVPSRHPTPTNLRHVKNMSNRYGVNEKVYDDLESNDSDSSDSRYLGRSSNGEESPSRPTSSPSRLPPVNTERPKNTPYLPANAPFGAGTPYVEQALNLLKSSDSSVVSFSLSGGSISCSTAAVNIPDGGIHYVLLHLTSYQHWVLLVIDRELRTICLYDAAESLGAYDAVMAEQGRIMDYLGYVNGDFSASSASCPQQKSPDRSGTRLLTNAIYLLTGTKVPETYDCAMWDAVLRKLLIIASDKEARVGTVAGEDNGHAMLSFCENVTSHVGLESSSDIADSREDLNGQLVHLQNQTDSSSAMHVVFSRLLDLKTSEIRQTGQRIDKLNTFCDTLTHSIESHKETFGSLLESRQLPDYVDDMKNTLQSTRDLIVLQSTKKARVQALSQWLKKVVPRLDAANSALAQTLERVESERQRLLKTLKEEKAAFSRVFEEAGRIVEPSE